MILRGRHIGPGGVFVIAEIGVNHDGDPARALALISAAHRAGADAIKLQVFRADLLLSRAASLAMYQHEAGERDPADMLRRLELEMDALDAGARRAHALGMAALATVFSLELVPDAAALEWDAWKIASPDIVHRPLIEALARDGRPIVVSTGAATMDEVVRALDWTTPAETAALHCVSAYPTPLESASIGGVVAMLRESRVPIGYSDHTESVETGALAVSAGATILEKHLTDNRARPGPDHRASLDECGLAEYIARARRAVDNPVPIREGAPGVGPLAKAPLEIERDVRRTARQSIVAARTISEGARIRREDLTIKRPGVGVAPWRMDAMIGCRARATVEADTLILEDQVRWTTDGSESASSPARALTSDS